LKTYEKDRCESDAKKTTITEYMNDSAIMSCKMNTFVMPSAPRRYNFTLKLMSDHYREKSKQRDGKQDDCNRRAEQKTCPYLRGEW